MKIPAYILETPMNLRVALTHDP